MSMTRIPSLLCCTLLSIPAWPQGLPSARARPPQLECPLPPAECHANPPVFNFGRAEVSDTTPPVYSFATISVTCTRAHLDGLDVEVNFQLHALPPTPARQMRNQIGGGDLSYLTYDMFIDSARTRYWGDGSQGTFVLTGTLLLNDRNRVGTIAFPIYGTVLSGQGFVPPGQWLGAVVARVKYDPVCH